eukprot:2111386-Prymnesium_polylepis.1
MAGASKWDTVHGQTLPRCNSSNSGNPPFSGATSIGIAAEPTRSMASAALCPPLLLGAPPL